MYYINLLLKKRKGFLKDNIISEKIKNVIQEDII